MLIAYLPFVICLVGALVYAFASNPKAAEMRADVVKLLGAP